MSEKSHTDSNDTDVTRVKNDTDVTLVQSVDLNEEQTILNSNPSANSSTEQTTNESAFCVLIARKGTFELSFCSALS